MKITTWPEVKAGQIVQFMYKSDGATKSYRRTVLCLDPKYRYRKKSTNRIVELFIGLELEKFGTRRPLNRIETKLLFEKLSKIEDDILGSSTAKTRMEDIYQDLRLFISLSCAEDYIDHLSSQNLYSFLSIFLKKSF